VKGIVFTFLQDVVTDEYGEQTWDDLLDAAGVDGAYTAVATYPDEQMSALVGAASAALGLPGDDILVWFGRKCIAKFAADYPELFEGHSSARSLALALNDIIHPQVRKLMPGAYIPQFGYNEENGPLEISYTSKRRLCSFAEGLLLGTCDHFGEQGSVAHVRCMKHGDSDCVLQLSTAS
jgi:hypothetical protein